MSTRACYVFKDDNEVEYTVYVHSDGYITGAAEKFADTVKSDLIWDLPRFEMDEFAAGFVAANKQSSGSVRLCRARADFADIEYCYTLTESDGVPYVLVEWVNNWEGWKSGKIWEGPLVTFIEEAESIEQAYNESE